MMTNVIAIPLTLIFYHLLSPISRFWLLLAVALDLTQNTINAVNAWTQFAPLTLLSGSPDLAAIPHAELASLARLARLALKWHDVGFQIGLTFFGIALAIYGVLIRRSSFFPRFLGLLYGFAGASSLLNAYAFFLAPRLPVDPYVLYVSLLGEGALALWLLIVGVDEMKWRAAAARS